MSVCCESRRCSDTDDNPTWGLPCVDLPCLHPPIFATASAIDPRQELSFRVSLADGSSFLRLNRHQINIDVGSNTIDLLLHSPHGAGVCQFLNRQPGLQPTSQDQGAVRCSRSSSLQLFPQCRSIVSVFKPRSVAYLSNCNPPVQSVQNPPGGGCPGGLWCWSMSADGARLCEEL